MLVETDNIRLGLSGRLDSKRKAQLGQFLTPSPVAHFMASLFTGTCDPKGRLLDAGAGIGSLSAAFLERWISGGFDFERLEVDAFEIDEGLHPYLTQLLGEYARQLNIVPKVHGGDFVEAAVGTLSGDLFAEPLPRYTHAILNPPYRKIRTNSRHRSALRQVGIETVNLYSAFVALSLALLQEGGQLVAIIPRSFCNGPYYKPFRDFMLARAAIRGMHLFDSRNKAFKDDGVLQENLILHLERGGEQGDVAISTSADASFAGLTTHTHPFERIVFPDDPERFIHVPTSHDRNTIEVSANIRHSLDGIGVNVSTGPVVDFRMKEHLRKMPAPGTAPLLYPVHFKGQSIEWPKADIKKPNAIHRNAKTEKWLYPNGFYCVVRRFSAKEEKRRIVASVVDPSSFPEAKKLGFENHLNVFHSHKQGLPEPLAHGLAVFLNTTAVDDCFRRFSGHTQVNATDLRAMEYPSREALIAMGKWAMRRGELTQAMIDEQLENATA